MSSAVLRLNPAGGSCCLQVARLPFCFAGFCVASLPLVPLCACRRRLARSLRARLDSLPGDWQASCLRPALPLLPLLLLLLLLRWRWCYLQWALPCWALD